MNSEILTHAIAKAVFWSTILIVVTIISVYLLQNWRDQVNKEDTTSDHLTKFRELHGRGVLGEEEFRTIKTALSERLRQERTKDGDKV